jgi:hypothetical protein
VTREFEKVEITYVGEESIRLKGVEDRVYLVNCVGWRYLPEVGDTVDVLKDATGAFYAVKYEHKLDSNAVWYFLAFVLGCVVWHLVERLC